MFVLVLSYVNDFIDRGRVKKVYVQAESQFRMLPQDIGNLYVRNNVGQMDNYQGNGIQRRRLVTR